MILLITQFSKIISKKIKLSPHIAKTEFDLKFLIVNCWVVKNNYNMFIIDCDMKIMGEYSL